MDRPHAPRTRTIGPYQLITRLDPPGTPVPCHRFVARAPGGDRTVVAVTPVQGADPARFAAEADAARRLMGPWVAPVVDLAPPGTAPWYAHPYLPALPLPTALAVHGGPLPERTVRALGAALAETLAGAHAQGVVHAGLSPAAVLLAPDGPRLGCFGAARTGTPGLDPGALPPERGADGAAAEPGDVYALGAVLAYAATGHTVPERSELPEGLRPLLASCLTRDPAARPTAAALLGALAPPSPHATVVSTAAPLLAPGWLPGRVVAAVARQSAAVLAAELPDPVRN
ncbi:serine/threonine protein kinase [Streptomyces sp. NPDC001941]|uniref:serine/threonine protein kinase n=1 Tax=Streptomyces sp. NPDC001941 TaxID=3154659 RepID=UPI00332E0892